jgi:hypothetical protein
MSNTLRNTVIEGHQPPRPRPGIGNLLTRQNHAYVIGLRPPIFFRNGHSKKADPGHLLDQVIRQFCILVYLDRSRFNFPLSKMLDHFL